MTTTDLGLEREMRKVLLALEVTSSGSTASYNSNGGGDVGSKPPAGAFSRSNEAPHVYYSREWEAVKGRCRWRLALAQDDDTRRAVLGRSKEEGEALLAEAKDELDAIQHSRAGEGSETEQQRTRRLLEKAGFPAAEVAVDLRMTEAQVRKTRVVHGRDPELGEIDLSRKVIADAIEPDERRRLARELHDKHRMSSHQIAPLIGVSQMQAWRDLKATETALRTAA